MHIHPAGDRDACLVIQCELSKVLWWAAKQVAGFVHVSTDSDVGSFPVAPAFVAIICDVFRVSLRAISERGYNFFKVRGIRLQGMRTENCKFDLFVAASKSSVTSHRSDLRIPMCIQEHARDILFLARSRFELQDHGRSRYPVAIPPHSGSSDGRNHDGSSARLPLPSVLIRSGTASNVLGESFATRMARWRGGRMGGLAIELVLRRSTLTRDKVEAEPVGSGLQVYECLKMRVADGPSHRRETVLMRTDDNVTV
ncbi:hypothetical protein KCU81_g462, partial [Aureobasidium melanogenum]